MKEVQEKEVENKNLTTLLLPGKITPSSTKTLHLHGSGGRWNMRGRGKESSRKPDEQWPCEPMEQDAFSVASFHGAGKGWSLT